MARIPNNELDRLKREVALVRLVESSGIELNVGFRVIIFPKRAILYSEPARY